MSDAPDTASKAHDRQARAQAIVADCYAGPLHIRDRGKEYLPQFPRESDDAYKDRLNSSVFYDATSRTIDGLVGMLLRADPKLGEDVADEVKVLWEDVDSAGNHADVFLRERARDAEVDGHTVIFVDMQPRVEGARNRVESTRDLRPYWVGIRKQNILDFETQTSGGTTHLTYLRFRQVDAEREGTYGQREVERIREYTLGEIDGGGHGVSYQVWRRVKGAAGAGDEWTDDGSGPMRTVTGEPMSRIPAAIAYFGDRLGVLESAPPHLALALENVKHYQLVADNDHVLHLACVPQFYVKGELADSKDGTISPNRAWELSENGAIGYAEVQGHGLEAMERRIEKSENRMAILGLTLLTRKPQAPQTATAERIDKAESDSALASHSRALQDATEMALDFTAEWLGLGVGAGGSCEMPKDFQAYEISPQMLQVLKDAVAEGSFHLEDFLTLIQRAVPLADFIDPKLRAELLSEGTPTTPEEG